MQEVYGEEAELKSIENDSQSDTKEDDCSEKSIQGVEYGSSFEVSDNLNEANGWETGVGTIELIKFESADVAGKAVFEGGERVRLEILAIAHEKIESPILGFMFRDKLGQTLFGENTLPFTDVNPMPVSAGGKVKAEFDFHLPMIPNGDYTITVTLGDGNLYNHVQHHWLHDAFLVHVFSAKVRFGLVGLKFDNIALSYSGD